MERAPQAERVAAPRGLRAPCRMPGQGGPLGCDDARTRLRILELLRIEGERSVSEIYTALGVEQAVASQHLGLMTDKGVLQRRKDGVHVYYRVGNPSALKVLDCMRSG